MIRAFVELVGLLAIEGIVVLAIAWIAHRLDPDVERLHRNRKERADIKAALRREVK